MKAQIHQQDLDWAEMMNLVLKHEREKMEGKKMKEMDNEKDKKIRKLAYVRKNEKDICVFVTFSYKVIEKNLEGEWQYKGRIKENGLLIKNRIYLEDDKFKFLRTKGLVILDEFEGIPNWATKKQIEKYQNFLGEKQYMD